MESNTDPTLLCPLCGGDYLTHGKVEVFDRKEDCDQGLHTIIDENHVETIYGPLTGNPSPRRDGLRIMFHCEQCGVTTLALVLYQHKGITMMGWEL